MTTGVEPVASATPRRMSLGGRFLRFAAVGTMGYFVNLAVFTALLHLASVGYVAAATASFGVAVTQNYVLNRAWTFRDARAAFFGQGARFLLVSLGALGVNLLFLHFLIAAGASEVVAQATAIAFAFPVNFIGNRVWSFRVLPEPARPVPSVFAPSRAPQPLRAIVCLPTFNERENLGPMLIEVRRHLTSKDLVLVIDDNSPDGTGVLADQYAEEFGCVHVMHRPGKEGLGRAYLDGFRYALSLGAEFVLEMDCDFSHDPAEIPRLLVAAETSGLALGSRYVSGGSAHGLGALRRIVSRAGCGYARVVLGVAVRDLTGGFKCFRRDALLAVGLDSITSSGYVFQVETTYRVIRAGYGVREVPIRFDERRAGSSKMGLRIAAEAAWKVPALRLRLAAARGAAVLRSKPAAAHGST